jgi:methionyl-tRNA formyltransferase
MAMTEAMDAGDILLQRETAITADDTTGSLTARLARLGAQAIGEVIDGLRAGTIRPVPQPQAGVTFAPRIEAGAGRIDWTRPAEEIARLARAMAPAPSAFTTLGGRRLKIHRVVVEAGARGGPPGSVLATTPAGILVATGAGALRLLEVQFEGRRRLPAGEFLAGHPVPRHTCLGAS